MSHETSNQQSNEHFSTKREREPMRQGQQNRRGRGRNRKPQNPMARSFESAGPDMKIRGTPSHIAEKYMSLARDALSAGDPVLAENYLQHAEHYNRIILSYREQQGHQNGEAVNGARQRSQSGADQDGFDDAGDEGSEDLGTAPQPASVRSPAPDFESQQSSDRSGQNRSDGPQRRPRNRNSNGTRSGSRDRRPNQNDGSGPQARADRDGFASSDEQPEFLKRPVVRRPRREAEPASSNAQTDSAAVNEDSQD